MKAGQPTAVKEIIAALAKKHLTSEEDGFSDTKRGMSAIFLRALQAVMDARGAEKLKKRNEEKLQRMQELEKRNSKLWKKLTSMQKEEECSDPLLCYKARPLNGVWASAPYLHNGSVRTVRQLLVPSERQKEFNVGSREYDPRNMGFIDAGNSVMNTTLPGNFITRSGTGRSATISSSSSPS